MEVPGNYKCKEDVAGVETDLTKACYQHLESKGYVPCWTSRPYVSFVIILLNSGNAGNKLREGAT